MAEDKKFICRICDYIYGSEGAGADFGETENDWICPECGAEKRLFESVE